MKVEAGPLVPLRRHLLAEVGARPQLAAEEGRLRPVLGPGQLGRGVAERQQGQLAVGHGDLPQPFGVGQGQAGERHGFGQAARGQLGATQLLQVRPADHVPVVLAGGVGEAGP